MAKGNDGSGTVWGVLVTGMVVALAAPYVAGGVVAGFVIYKYAQHVREKKEQDNDRD